jgi:dTDP-4-amino-4,6-dideoxygalactose transaminase
MFINQCYFKNNRVNLMQFIDLQTQYQHLKRRIDKRIHDVLDHGKYIMGPEVQELEEKLADYVGVKHVITCANGTDALQLCLMVLDIKPGDAVFCPTFTFFATAEVIALAGATPIFVDSDPDTFNICPKDLELRIEKTISEGKVIPKAIIAVDLFGLPANYPELEDIAKKYKLKLIEDAAQGFGGSINGKKAGSFGDIATTSFFPAKPLGCYGDGGAVFTNNDEHAELLRSYRVHGKGKDKYDNVRIGLNSRLDTLQAAILLEKLAEFPQELMNRNKAATEYFKQLPNIYKIPTVPDGYISSWAQYTLQSVRRDEIMEEYKAKSIPTMIYYGTCMHQQTAFTSNKLIQDNFPIAERLSKQVFSLPMHGYLDVEAVIKNIALKP